MTISDCNRVVSHTKITQIIHLWYFPALYDGPLKLDTELRQIKTLNFVVKYGKDLTQKVHASIQGTSCNRNQQIQ